MSRILIGAMTVQKFMFYSRNKMSKFSSKNMDKVSNHPHSFKKWINIFFVVFILGILFMTGGLYYYTTSYSITGLHTEHGQSSSGDIKKVTSIIQYWIISLTILIVSAVGIIWYYFKNFILYPLNQVNVAAEQIGHGKLNKTIIIRAPLEMKRLSESINDLSVNLQEILLFIWNQTEISLRCLDIDEVENHDPKKVTEGISIVKQNMLELHKMISTFVLYDVCLDKRRVLDGSDKESNIS
jgi:methyl-accepting chemotaxis protein